MNDFNENAPTPDLQTSETAYQPNPFFGLNKRIAAACLGLGVAFNYLFFDHEAGISYPLFILCFYAVLYGLKLPGGFLRQKNDWLISCTVFLLSATFAIYSNPVLTAINHLLIPLIILSQLTLLSDRERRWDQLFGVELLLRLVAYAVQQLTAAYKAVTSLFNIGFVKNPVAKKIIVGLIVALPLFVVLLILLSSADEIFKEKLQVIMQFLEDISVYEIVARTIQIVFITFLLTLLLLAAAYFSDRQNLLTVQLRWDGIIFGTVLVIINLLFLFFCLIQINYLFLPWGELPPGLSYAVYARKGFFELCTVAVINFIILLAGFYLVKKESDKQKGFLRIQLSLLTVLTALLLVSAFYRMCLYEAVFGLTYLRFFTQVFMVMLLTLLSVTMVRIYREELSLRKYLVAVSMIFYLILNYLNTDQIIASYNLNKARNGYQGSNAPDVMYLLSLSADAVPALQEYCRQAGSDPASVQTISNELYKRKYNLHNYGHFKIPGADYSWQEFNLGRYRADWQ